jgi:hypothetical protein
MNKGFSKYETKYAGLQPLGSWNQRGTGMILMWSRYSNNISTDKMT